jgi:DNA polymerase-3 subunit chi
MRVDFYLIEDEDPAARWIFLCRLIEKAYLRGHRIYIHCQNQADAEHLDELLWTYKDDSFVPHNLQGEGPEPPPPVQMGYDKEPRGFHDILINLADPVPDYFKRFNRVIECVGSTDAEKEISRQHYRSYRAEGCTLQHTNVARISVA